MRYKEGMHGNRAAERPQDKGHVHQRTQYHQNVAKEEPFTALLPAHTPCAAEAEQQASEVVGHSCILACFAALVKKSFKGLLLGIPRIIPRS